MLTEDRQHLVLMFPVRENPRLKKFRNNKDEQNRALNETFDVFMKHHKAGVHEEIWDGVPFTIRRVFKTKIQREIVALYIKIKMLRIKQKGATEFFEEIKDSFEELKKLEETSEEIKEFSKGINRTIQYQANISLTRQEKLIEKEKVLFNAGITRYQEEKSIVKFVLLSKKGLRFTEIDLYDRNIPEDVFEKINKADDLEIFDNYYILHYDPDGAKNEYYTMTEEEKKDKKDPIVFGVIKDSTKLYFIADWIDEKCDLTYSHLLKNLEDTRIAEK